MKFKLWIAALPLALLAGALATLPAHAASGVARSVSLAGTGGPQSGNAPPSGDGDVTYAEFPGQLDEADGPGPYPGTITNRSLSRGSGKNGVSVNGGKKAKSNPQFNLGFEGLNFYQQRYSHGGNQFSVEPPDQGMCVGNGYVLEAVNDVLNVFNADTGQSVLARQHRDQHRQPAFRGM